MFSPQEGPGSQVFSPQKGPDRQVFSSQEGPGKKVFSPQEAPVDGELFVEPRLGDGGGRVDELLVGRGRVAVAEVSALVGRNEREHGSGHVR